jgi:hypothetical protein
MPDLADDIAALPNVAEQKAREQESLTLEGEGNDSVLTLRSKTIRTLEGALAEGKVDTAIWEVERWVLNKWPRPSYGRSRYG